MILSLNIIFCSRMTVKTEFIRNNIFNCSFQAYNPRMSLDWFTCGKALYYTFWVEMHL